MDDKESDIQDLMNPPGMFIEGKRQRDYSSIGDPLPMSAKLIPEYAGRRSIRDMLTRKPSLPQAKGSVALEQKPATTAGPFPHAINFTRSPPTSKSPAMSSSKHTTQDVTVNSIAKRAKYSTGTVLPSQNVKGQQTLKEFFISKPNGTSISRNSWDLDAFPRTVSDKDKLQLQGSHGTIERFTGQDVKSQPDVSPVDPSARTDPTSEPPEPTEIHSHTSPVAPSFGAPIQLDVVHDPIESKETWSKLFTKPIAPLCEGHGEPCISLLTKKPGMNLGRSFWMCPRPLGPSGAKERKTQWRCQTFIWCSDWNPHAGIGS